jgi:copper type II ascorbate-dependent monooxygenase-like protein
MTNPVGAFVRRFRADLTQGSHHMIVYRSNATTESPTPVPCQSFSGLLSGEHPLFIAQQLNSDLVFPTDDSGVPVGFQIDPMQMVRMELHYINTTEAPIQVTGKALVDTVPLSTKVTTSDIAFEGTSQFDIPPNSMADTGIRFQGGLPGTKTFALTTHQHHLGTRMRVWYAKDASDTSHAPVADSMSWSNPPLVLFAPPLDFPASNTPGFAYECQWDNTTAQNVTFGEGFYNEMCFLWHYYYPSQGFRLCIDGQCAPGLP